MREEVEQQLAQGGAVGEHAARDGGVHAPRERRPALALGRPIRHRGAVAYLKGDAIARPIKNHSPGKEGSERLSTLFAVPSTGTWHPAPD